MAVDSRGGLHTVYYTEEEITTDYYIHRLWYRNASGFSEEIGSWTTTSHHSPISNMDIDIDPSNGVHIVYGIDLGERHYLYVKKAPPPIILVWGWNGCAENWDLIKPWLEDDGFNVTVLNYDDSKYATVGANTLASCVTYYKALGYPKVDIIAHSFGGLVSRTYIEDMGGDNNVRNLIMIATPNHGTRLADYLTGTIPDDPLGNSLMEIGLGMSRQIKEQKDWDSSINLRTIDNPRLSDLNNNFNPSSINTNYFTIAGTHPYPDKWTSYKSFLPGYDDGVTTVDSVTLPEIPLYCIGLDHSSILNPYRVLNFDPFSQVKNQEIQDETAKITYNLYSNVIREILDGTPPNPTLYPKPPGGDPTDNYILPTIFDKIVIRINNGQNVKGNLNIPSSYKQPQIEIGFKFEFSDFIFNISTPSGTVITPEVAQTDPDIGFTIDDHYWYYTIMNPEAGLWGYSITATEVPLEGENLTIYALGCGGWSTGSPITVVSPNGGEKWKQGSTQTIRWNYTGDVGSSVKIEALRGEKILATVTSSYPIGSEGSGSYNLTFPYGTPLGSDYFIRVTSTSNATYTDTSDAPFTIIPPITVLSPNGGEEWEQGTTQTISWDYIGNPGPSVKVEVLRGDTVLAVISPGTPVGSGGSGSLNLTLPINAPLGTEYRIRISSTSNAIYTDTSDAPFKIIANASSSITLTTPNGGENWVQGSAQTLRWNYTGNPGTMVKIEALKGDKVLAVITPSSSIGSGGSGFYNLTFPFATPIGTDYKIRITSISNPAWTDTSDDNFTINSAITVATPNGGENYPIGSTLPMSWTYTGNPGSTVNIDVFKGTSILKTLIGIPIGSGGSGLLNVTIPPSTPLGSDYKIRVTSASYPACTDTSYGAFSISAA